MAVRHIVMFPEQESVLRKPSKAVTKFDRETSQLIRDLKDTVLEHPAVGLAAPQIGVHKRIIVARFGQTKTGREELSEPVAIVNPRIIMQGELVREYDACLSISGLYGYTLRPYSLEIKGLDENGRPLHKVLFDLDARVIHHEIDHLDGILFLDRIRDQQRDLFVIVENHVGESIAVPYAKFMSEMQSTI